jgi:glucokinase
VNSDNQILVGDVGGTQARFAVVQPSDTGPWRILHRLDLAERFATFNDALRSYLERAGLTPLPRLAAIAVAGPVAAGTARFTNRGWEISERALREVGFERALLINDFAALALAVDLLDEKHLHPIGPQRKGVERGTITILGAGTGFGVSCLARYGDRAVPMASEGGHMSFAPGDAEELAALQLLWKHEGRVSIERILSGDGLEHLLHRGRDRRKDRRVSDAEPVSPPLRGQGTVDPLRRGNSHPADRVSGYRPARSGAVGHHARARCSVDSHRCSS